MFRVNQTVWILRPNPVKGKIVKVLCSGTRVKVEVPGVGIDTYRSGDVYATRDTARRVKKNMDKEAVWRSW